MNNQNNEELRIEINARLFYALGDIEPTDDRMTRAVESIANLISSQLVEAEKRGEVRIIQKLKEGSICECCGGDKDPENLTSMCDKCLENN